MIKTKQMEGIAQQIQDINEKLFLLLKQHAFAQKRVKQLTKENEEIKARLKMKDAHAVNLHEQMDALKISGKYQDEGSRKELEKRINHYLKEIDKCLALLNV